ncbi:MAG: DUF1592 domain-containing protein, partial [Myxococcales bacterium]|nr:DUF1592 domain-containing protein [Myxococcales bacterium]
LDARAQVGFTDAMEVLAATVLQAPAMIYLEEQGTPIEGAPDEIRKLTDHELASRLSYFLWDTMPDDELRAAADGHLVKQSVYHDDADAIPEPVRALAAQRFPQATITGYETEHYADLGRIYEVEVDDGGKSCEVAAQADGTEVYTECRIDPTTLDAKVKATVDAVAPGGRILEAETKKGPSVDEITVEVQAGDRELYLRIRPDGTLIEALRRIPAIVEVPLPRG